MRNTTTRWTLFACLATGVSITGCSSGGTEGSGGGGGSLVYPAPHPAVPQAVSLGGAVLATPQFMSISFSGDTASEVTSIDDFIATVGATPYWAATTSEYGVGPATAVAPVHLTETAPTSIENSEVKMWLEAKLAGTSLGTPNSNTIYVVFYPTGTTVTYGGGKSCSGFGGYHGSVTLPGGMPIAYAVIPRCKPDLQSALEATTSAASHELIEAATNPFDGAPAYQSMDLDHIIWKALLIGELADFCVFESSYTPASYRYFVQRSWSNAAARAGKDFCQPSLPGEVFFQSVPVLTDSVPFSWRGQPQPGFFTKGVHIPVGTSKTIDVDLYSEGPTAPWDVYARAVTEGTLAFSWNKKSGVNGDVLKLTITSLAADSNYGGAPFYVYSARGTRVRFYVGFVN